MDGVDVGTTALAAEDMVEVEGKVRTGKGAIGADETPAEDWSHTIAEAVLVVVEAGLVADNKLEAVKSELGLEQTCQTKQRVRQEVMS